MKNSASLGLRTMLAVACAPAAVVATAQAQTDVPYVYESYDKNPTGDMMATSGPITTSGGYGVTGTYGQQGTYSANAFQVLSRTATDGLSFGTFNPYVAGVSKYIEVNATTATGVGIALDGGKAQGDIMYHYFDQLYVSCLVKFSVATNNSANGGRAEIRVSDAVTGAGNPRFQVGLDRGVSTTTNTTTGVTTNTTGVLQPQVSYNNPTSGTWIGNSNSAQPTFTGVLQNGITYMMISRFENSGNTLSSVTTSGTWTTSSTRTVSVASAAGISVGFGVVGAGIPDGTIVTSISGLVVTLSATPTAAGTSASITFSQVGRASIWALTLDQYNSFIATGLESYLDNATIGTGVSQVSAKVISPFTPTSATNYSLGQGNGICLIAEGNTGTGATAQRYAFDELRYGYSLQAVTKPAAYPTGPANQAQDSFDNGGTYYYPTYYFDSGSGWKSGWYELPDTSDRALGALKQPSENPIVPNGGKFLRVTSSTVNSGDQGIRRRPDPTVVDMSQPYTVTFDYSPETSTLSAATDRIQIGGDGTGTGFTYSSAAMTWLVGAVGSSTDTPVWYFFSKENASSADLVADNMINTGVQVQKSHVYRFKIEADTVAKTYKATISDYSWNLDHDVFTLNKTYTKAGLKFRIPTAVANTLMFGISKAAATERSFLLDNVTVSQGIDFYSSWMATYTTITADADKLRTADPDKDGRVNFLEFALDGNPASGTRSGKSSNTISNIGGVNYYTLTVPVRTGLTFDTGTTGSRVSSTNADGIQYTIQGSYNLVDFNADVLPVEPALSTGLPALNTVPGWNYKTFRLAQPVSAQPKGFLRVKVVSTP